MYAKLALRNIKRSAKDYFIYFATLTIVIAVMFAFNLLIFSAEVQALSEQLSELMLLIIFVSVLIVFVCGWLVNYITRFIVQKRGQEFAIYQTLGMEKKQISRLFLREGLLIGLVSLGAGILAGEFVYQILKAVVMNVFEAPFAPSLEFSVPALVLTLVFFLLIYPLALARSNKWLKKSDVLQLMSTQRRNEVRGIKSKTAALLVMMLSIAGLVFAVLYLHHLIFLMEDEAILPMLGLFALMCLCMYGLYVSLSCYASFLKFKKFRYKGANLFLLRQFTSKVNSTGMLMGTISLLLMFSLLSFWGGFLFNGFYQTSMDIDAPFDIAMYTDGPEGDFTAEYEYISQNYKVENSIEYQLHDTGQRKMSGIINNETGGFIDGNDFAMRLSDYNRLRQERGWEPVALDGAQYALHADQKSFEEMFAQRLAGNDTLRVAGQDYAPGGIYGGGFGQTGLNGWLYVLVLPDEAAEALPVAQNNMIVTTQGGAPAELQDELDQMANGKSIADSEFSRTYVEGDKQILVRRDTIAGSLAGITVIGFAAFYLGLCLLIICATVLAVQQLSDSAKFKYRFDVIRKMGVSAKEANRIVLKQLAAYFLFPVVIPVVLVVCMVVMVSGILQYSMISGAEASGGFLLGFVVLMVIYACYLVWTYVGYRRNIA